MWMFHEANALTKLYSHEKAYNQSTGKLAK